MTATPTPDDGALAACPLCHGTKVEIYLPQQGETVFCAECGCEGPLALWNTRSPAPVSGEAARVKELEGVLRYIIEYGERSGLKRVQQVCDMTLKGMDMSPLRQEPPQHCAGAGREGG